MFRRFAKEQPRHRDPFGRFRPRSRKTDRELLRSFGLALQVQGDDAIVGRFQLGPMAQGRAADGLDIEAGRQEEAQTKNPRAGDVHSGVGGENGPVFAEREGILGFNAHVRLDGGGFQRSGRLAVGVTECAPDGEAGNLRLQRGRNIGREIFQVDG